MFSKLKNFSEDLAKTINQDLIAAEGTNGGKNAINQRRQAAAIKELKNGDQVLQTSTPAASELTQPEDEPEEQEVGDADKAREGNEIGKVDEKGEKVGQDGAEKKEGGDPVARSKTATPVPQQSRSPVPSSTIGIDIESLPTGIRSKMKKFAKYEEKYPVLLDAYKTEKRKTDLIAIFEKILQEHTPVTSISDAGSLVEYLNGLNEKTSMLNSEFRKVTGENAKLLKEKKQLESSLVEFERSQAKSKGDIKELESKIDALTTEIESLKANESTTVDSSVIEELEAKLEKKEFELKEVESKLKESVDNEEKVQSIRKENDTLKADNTKLTEELESKESDFTKEIKLLNEKIEELKDKTASAVLSTASTHDSKQETVIPASSASNENNSSNNKKKKNKKGGNKGGNVATTVPAAKQAVDEAELSTLTMKYEALVKEHDELYAKYTSTKSKLESKEEDLENLRDSLKNIGNDLVQAREEIKDLKSNSSNDDELSGLKIQLKENVSEVQKLSGTVEQQSKEIASQKSKLEDQEKLKLRITSLTKELDSVKEEKIALNNRINELTKYKANDSSLKLEISTLQVSINHKDTKIKDLSSKVEELTKLKEEQRETIQFLKNGQQELQYSNKTLINEKNELVNKQELSFERAQSLSSELSKLQTEKHLVKTELDNVKTKYDLLLKQKSSSSEDFQSFKQQYEELSMKSKESLSRIDSLEDELNEARNMLQERTREGSSIRRALLDSEDQNKLKASEFKAELKKWKEEKFMIESNFQTLIKKKQREIDESKSITSNYLLKIQELEVRCNELKAKYDDLQEQGTSKSKFANGAGDSADFEDAQQTIETLRSSLQNSSKRVKEFENLNNILKKLNEEANLKFERLSKNYKIVTQQYKQAKDDANNSRRESTSSISSRGSNGALKATAADLEGKRSLDGSEDGEKGNGNSQQNIAYLKNVLLGYFEHKDQREMLLPVLKMLFQLSPEDEMKFTQAVK
ncbi:golgin Imh1p [[Candida] railenensis]|uniref:Golgin Imh1p n=1 Tax=[Candida] railenensis TaxID=45579 RepID=A0A9P0QQ05_9ASCO|nr:golgin Imh1p [[Candida] railenensis]